MGNSVRSMPRKALPDKGFNLVSILLYDKEFPIMSIIGNRPDSGKLLIFQDSKKDGREAENGCLTPLQWIGNFLQWIKRYPYNESMILLQLISNPYSESVIAYNEWVISTKHHLNASPAIQHYLASTDANTAASNTTRANT